MARKKGADVTVRTHPEENEIERTTLEHAGEVAGIGACRRVEIGRLAADPMHARRIERNAIEPEAAREMVVGLRVVVWDGALVAPEDVDARPLDGGGAERRKERLRHRPAGQRAGEPAVRRDRVTCR